MLRWVQLSGDGVDKTWCSLLTRDSPYATSSSRILTLKAIPAEFSRFLPVHDAYWRQMLARLSSN